MFGKKQIKTAPLLKTENPQNMNRVIIQRASKAILSGKTLTFYINHGIHSKKKPQHEKIMAFRLKRWNAKFHHYK